MEDFRKNTLIENYKRILRVKSINEDLNADRRELANLIYDKLMDNTQHPQFDISEVSEQYLNDNAGIIEFNYGKYVKVKLTVNVLDNEDGRL